MQKQVEYEETAKTKYPVQVVIAIARDKNAKANPITIGCTTVVSIKPPMMSISVGNSQYSMETIRHSKCFTIAFPSLEMAELALFFGSKSGRDTDKFAESDCRTTAAKEIDSILLDEATANFECVLESETLTGDCTTFVGRIVASHINTEKTQRLYAIAPGHKMGPIS